jgi:hypothetical protein
MDTVLRELLCDVNDGEIGRGVAPICRHPDGSYSTTFGGKWYMFRATKPDLDDLLGAFERAHTFIEWNVSTYDAHGNLVDVGR